MLPLVPPKTPLGQALGYLYRYWSRLVRYVERGDLPIDSKRPAIYTVQRPQTPEQVST